MLGFLSGSQDWMLILAGTTLFPSLFGFIAQMCSNAGTNSGLYDVVNELMALFSLWLIALYGLLFFAVSKYWQRGGSAREVDVEEHARSEKEPCFDTGGEEASPFIRRFDAFCAHYGITLREREVLSEALHGYSMENIGRKLYVSKETVKTHLRRVYAKAGVSGKQELITLVDKFDENDK